MMLLLLAAAKPKTAASVTSAAARTRLLHHHHGASNPILRAVAPKDPAEAPRLQTDGVVREAFPARLATGGLASSNAAALDPALAAGAPTRPGWRIQTHEAPATGQQKMATEQDVIAADEGTSTAEFLPQRTP